MAALLDRPLPEKHWDLSAFHNTDGKINGLHPHLALPPCGVPPDNNALERAVRNVKVKKKVSGQFKTQEDA